MRENPLRFKIFINGLVALLAVVSGSFTLSVKKSRRDCG